MIKDETKQEKRCSEVKRGDGERREQGESGQRGVWRNVREAEKGVSSGRLPAALPPL